MSSTLELAPANQSTFAVPDRIARFLDATTLPSPSLVVDGALIPPKLEALQRALPEAEILYAIKANPMPQVVRMVGAAGAGCDVASGAEIRTCIEAGVAPERISFGNPIKHPDDIAFAHALGITRFTIDSVGELEKVARFAPGAAVSVRLLVNTEGAQWPLSRKFGCDAAMAAELLKAAPGAGLRPGGLSFHVGSQQTDPQQWDGPIALCAALQAELRHDGIEIETLNLGGGFPAQYTTPVPAIDVYARAIRGSVQRHFGRHAPRLVVEPGRALVAEAGVIQASVLLVARKSRDDAFPWVFLDCGKFGGLAETMDEAIRYPIVAPHRGDALVPMVVAGPTCDSADILYERTPYDLPSGLRTGDRVHILSTGAYTFTYASVAFNGFAPLRTVFL